MTTFRRFALAVFLLGALRNPLVAQPPSGELEPVVRTAVTTCFQTGRGYDLALDMGADFVLVMHGTTERVASWKDAGYSAGVMYGLRDSMDFCEGKVDGVSRLREIQTSADGRYLDCGPGSMYMVPSASKTARAVSYFREAVRGGAAFAAPEEPEFWGFAGYSPAFKDAYEAHFGEPWQDAVLSPDLRFRTEYLKAKMEIDLFTAIYRASREEDPGVQRMLLLHSPVNYALWRAGFTHTWGVSSPDVDAIVGQVWTGTARSPVPLAGISAERTFLTALLEYSSCANLVRASDRPMWFLMDPVEDNPDRTMEDYIHNYTQTLLAALCFPEIDRFELMPWPERIFGRVPDDYATVVHSAARVLETLWEYRGEASLDAGTPGIGILMGETTAWMNNPPAAVGLNGLFGLALPLVARGIRPEILMMERVADPGYLDGIRLLLVSTEFAKPMSCSVADALLQWAESGGALAIIGGHNRYDKLDAWWRRDGYASALDYLLERSGAVVPRAAPRAGLRDEPVWTELARETEQVCDLRNRKTRTFDVAAFRSPQGRVWLSFRDALPDDGWGPHVTSVTATSHAGGKVAAFVAGSAEEERYLARSSGSLAGDGRRFADGTGYWIYEFPFPPGASSCEVTVEVGNQFVIEAAPAGRTTRLLQGQQGWPDQHLPSDARVTAWPVGSVSATVLLLDGPEHAAAFTRPLGAGSVIHVGVSPETWALSPGGDAQSRDVIRLLCGEAGMDYNETGRYLVRRGPYVAVRVLEDAPAFLMAGRYVDLLDAALPIRENVSIPPGEGGLFLDLGHTESETASPSLVFSTARVTARSAGREGKRYRITGALGTPQMLLFDKGGLPVAVSAVDETGVAVETEISADGPWLRVRAPGNPRGTILSLERG